MLPRYYRTETDIRKRQINTLKVFNENVTEVTESYEYQVLFKANGTDYCIHVSLSNDFPNEKPKLKVTPFIAHPWVNTDGEITGAPGLLNFTVHSDLGRVVQVIARELQRTVEEHSSGAITSPTIPVIVAESESSGRGSPSYQAFTGLKNFSPPSHMPQGISTPKSLAFPELNSLSIAELEFLNESTNRQEEFVQNLPQIREMNRTIDDIITQVEELADSNLSKREQLQGLRKDIDVKIEEAAKLAFENERLHAHYQGLSDKYSPKNIREKLRKAAEQADNESEQIADSFLQGEIDVDKFLATFLKTRTLCQIRKTKEERFSHQLDSLEKAGF